MSDAKALREKVKDLKVLFVDDEEDVRNGTGIFLNKFFNNVVICKNGKEGLDTFTKTQDFDVIITDVLMPAMDGIEMSEEIKKLDSDIFIVILTASRGVKDLDKNISNITLQKPLSFENMLLILKHLDKKND